MAEHGDTGCDMERQNAIHKLEMCHGPGGALVKKLVMEALSRE